MATDALLNTTIGGCLILEVIGQGGMGVIYKARQRSLDRIVALKILAPHLANDVNFVARFQREARAIARVNHPNILAVYDVGDDQNINYMIMELIDGRSMAELQTDKRGALPWEEATTFVKQAAQGLEAAQAAGIIHRDIKPENLMVTKKNVVKVSDFGLAKEADSTNTSIDAVMGTPAFMSPEQCDGKKVDARSDIYSLGGTYYRLITGRLPFEAETAMSMMYRHKHEALIPPHEVVPSIPPAISTVICKMMAKKREQRYQTMTEVIDALDAALKPQPVPPPSIPAPKPEPRAGGPVMVVPASGAPIGAAPGGMAAADDVAPPQAGRFSSGDTDVIRRRDSVAEIQLRPPAGASARLPAAPGVGFGAAADSSGRMNVPSGIINLAPAGAGAVPDDAYTNVSRGDEMIARGDRLAGLKSYRQALASNTLDGANRARIEEEIRKEAGVRRKAAENLVKKGMLVEASRECRVLVELDPADEVGRALLKDVENKLTAKRSVVNEIRTAIATTSFEKAIKVWDGTPSELRDEAIGKQIEQLRNVVVPSTKLAEQGLSLDQQGRLEEAIAAYEDALKIHPSCEAARQGLKETQQKLQRIDFMLKEGLQFSLEQNYAKAVETWRPILQLRPGHPQAVKSIVDACIAQAQHLRAHGEIEGAWLAYRNAMETDPENRSIRKVYEELTNLRDKEQALMDRAHEATAHNRLGQALHNWKEVLRMNPASKRAQQQIAQLRSQRRGIFGRALLILVLLASVSAAAYWWWQEMKALEVPRKALTAVAQTETLADMRKQIVEWKVSDVARELEQAQVFIYKGEKEQLLADFAVWVRIEQALRKEDGSEFEIAEKELFALAKEIGAKNRLLGIKLGEQALHCQAVRLSTQAHAALETGKWEDSIRLFSELRALLQEQNVPGEPRQWLPQIEKKIALLQRLAAGEHHEQAGRKTDAYREYQSAQALVAELKLKTLENIVGKSIARVGGDVDKFNLALVAGKAALKAAPPDIVAARKAFEEALGLNPRDDVKAFLQYAKDLGECDALGMALYAPKHPLRPDDEGRYERSRAFCIDRYEFPNKLGGTPNSNMTWLEANDACIKIGKELCRGSQWTDACKGGADFTTQYPYGNQPDASACNTDGTGVKPSGSMPNCRNSIGVYDMSGNVAEWTYAEGDSADVMGGGYDTPVGRASCNDAFRQLKTSKALQIGFRCSKKLSTAEKR